MQKVKHTHTPDKKLCIYVRSDQFDFMRTENLRLRLHRRGFQSKRFDDLETVLKTTRFRILSLHGTYPTVKSNRLCQGDLVLRREKYLQGASPRFISQRKIPKRHSSKS